MLNKKLKDLTLAEALWAIFFGTCGLFALFCFLMAFSIALSRPAHAADYVMVPDLKAPKVQMEIDAQVCNTVGEVSKLMKRMIDRGDSNKVIKDRLVNAALRNTDDVNGWIAFNMMGSDKVINLMREWTTHTQFKALKLRFPDLDNDELYQAYGGGLCDELTINGKTVPVTPRNRVARGVVM